MPRSMYFSRLIIQFVFSKDQFKQKAVLIDNVEDGQTHQQHDKEVQTTIEKTQKLHVKIDISVFY